jgi:hypothetical protein
VKFFIAANNWCNAGSKDTGTGYPITGHKGPEVEWRHSFTLSLTSALDCGGVEAYLYSFFNIGARLWCSHIFTLSLTLAPDYGVKAYLYSFFNLGARLWWSRGIALLFL